MTSIIKKIENTLFNQAKEWINDPIAKAIGISSFCAFALDSVVYPSADLLGRELHNYNSVIFVPNIIKSTSRKYGNIAVKPIASFIQVIEYKILTYLFNKVTRNQRSTHLQNRNKMVDILQKSVANPPFSMLIIGPIIEEVAFRYCLTQTTGITNLAVTVISSVMFAYSHQESEHFPLQPGRVTALVSMGIAFAFLTNKFGFTTAILTHSCYNLSCWLRK